MLALYTACMCSAHLHSSFVLQACRVTGFTGTGHGVSRGRMFCRRHRQIGTSLNTPAERQQSVWRANQLDLALHAPDTPKQCSIDERLPSAIGNLPRNVLNKSGLSICHHCLILKYLRTLDLCSSCLFPCVSLAFSHNFNSRPLLRPCKNRTEKKCVLPCI